MPRNKYEDRIYKWKLSAKQDYEDDRDFKLSFGLPPKLPERNIYLYSYCGPIKNQGPLGSCVAFASCAALEIRRKLLGRDRLDLSELFTWYWARKAIQRELLNSGTFARDALHSLNHQGVPEEDYWPYRNEFKTEPGWTAKFAARFTRVKAYYRCYGVDDIRLAIHNKLPVVLCVGVTEDLLKPKPEQNVIKGEGSARFGHALCVVGYDDSMQAFLVRNSWSANWHTMQGYAWLSYRYVREYVLDAYAIE